MSALESALKRVIALLADAEVPFALIGGLAVSARVEPRFTRDADLAVPAATDVEAEGVIRHLVSNGCRPVGTVEQMATGRLATVRLIVDTPDGPVVDVLFASSGIEAEVVASAEPLEVLDDLRIPVATIGHLIALKLLSRDDERRPQDFVDLRGLLRHASPADLAQVRQAVGLITARGYHRGRDLEAELERILPGV